MHAVARLALHPVVPNIQASWVKMGPRGVAECLNAGVNDLGGTLMNESITRAAGASFGEELPPEEMESLISDVNRIPKQRSTAYGQPPERQVRRSFGAAALAPAIQTPAVGQSRPGSGGELSRPGLSVASTRSIG